ncbi:MAG: AAC(3) family N-acetyltransferase [Bacteroidales bacterium]|nr:AAC(3) family N-acetyltransferase [Bacteroidales bacterium]
MKLKKHIIHKAPTIKAFEEVLGQYKNDNCFVHGGYRQIVKFFDSGGGIENLIDILDNNFSNILSPAYTLNFKKNGVFHLKYSKPDIGYFGVEFAKHATFRSHDPIGSIWFRGNIDKNQLDLKRSFFADNGMYGTIANDKSLTLCIGTDTVKLSLLHYLEYKFNLPYRKEVIYEGVAYYDDDEFEFVKQKTTENIGILQVERERVEYEMLKEGILKRYDFGNFVLRIKNNKDFADFIKTKTDKDPYYLFFEKNS